MKKIIIFLLLFSNVILAQKTETDAIILHKIKELKENQISTFFIVEKYCVGCIKLVKENKRDCDYGTSTLYLFWKENGENFFRRLDKCNSPKIKISDDILSNFSIKMRSIKIEEIKRYQTGDNNYISLNHSNFSKYYFILDGELETNSFDYFNLTTAEEKPNINFKYNNSLMLVKLDKACDEIITKNK